MMKFKITLRVNLKHLEPPGLPSVLHPVQPDLPCASHGNIQSDTKASTDLNLPFKLELPWLQCLWNLNDKENSDYTHIQFYLSDHNNERQRTYSMRCLNMLSVLIIHLQLKNTSPLHYMSQTIICLLQVPISWYKGWLTFSQELLKHLRVNYSLNLILMPHIMFNSLIKGFRIWKQSSQQYSGYQGF